MPSPPIEPPPTGWEFPDPDQWPTDDLIAVGADLAPGTVLAGYRAGLFPMPVNRRHLGWWSPMRRGVLPLGDVVVSKSLRRSVRRFHLSFDEEFPAVIDHCATSRTTGNWISTGIRSAYLELHRLGWAHSVEARDDDGRLVGGLYGVQIGGLFAGESMFHHVADASKVALLGLLERLRHNGTKLIDTQWRTDHLASLGVIDISRLDYLRRLGEALPVPTTWDLDDDHGARHVDR